MNIDMNALTERFSQLAEQYGPTVVETARAAAQVQAMSALSGAAMAVFATLVFGFVGKVIWNYKGFEDKDLELFVAQKGLAAILFILAFIWSFLCLEKILDPWIWATLFVNPDLWIAKRILGL
jgi:hypothetical protein